VPGLFRRVVCTPPRYSPHPRTPRACRAPQRHDKNYAHLFLFYPSVRLMTIDDTLKKCCDTNIGSNKHYSYK